MKKPEELDELDTCLRDLKELYENNYVSFSDLEFFKHAHEKTIQKILKPKNFRSRKNKKQLKKLLNSREKQNQKFIKKEQQKTFQIEDSKLDQHQIAAVVASEDAELILAPAGSGKTATLLAKVNYLITHDKIPPEKILVIAFTNKVVAELKDRLKNDEVEIRTFHSFGNKIIKENFENHKLVAEDFSEKLIQKIIFKLKNHDEDFAKNYEKFLLGEDLEEHIFIQNNPITPEDFEEIISSAISLQKSERLKLKDLKTRIKKIEDENNKQEAEKLFKLYAPIFKIYEKFLCERNLYDFSDMLNFSTDFIKTLPNNSFDYRYILVDEAQDLSESKAELLKAILEKCARVKLFAVGDDWQSIYRFAGSNLKIIQDFENIFARKTFHGVIKYTYRFGQPTAKISNKFVTKNPFQSKKRVVPAVKKYTPIELELYSANQNETKIQNKNQPYFLRTETLETKSKNNLSENLSAPPDYFAVDKKLTELYNEFGEELKNQKIQIISRFNRDAFRLVDKESGKFKNAVYDPKTSAFKWQIRNETIKIPFCTIHKAKGITRDIVFVINVNSENLPASRDGNPMLETMQTGLDDYPFAEERRLFYVAITRAKNRTILIADKNRPSEFLEELPL